MLLDNEAAIYGELQAVVGGALPAVAALELPPADEPPEALALVS